MQKNYSHKFLDYGFLLCLLIIGSGPASSQATKKPNIIFILADDLGYGDLGCYGQKKIATPNIDQLAKGGMKMTEFYAGTSVCAPSRASLMTGMHTGHIPVRGNKGMKPEGQFPLPDSTITIANKLQQNGYQTAAFGKWGLGFITTSGDPTKKGFDQFFGYNCQTLAHNYYPDHLWNNHDRIDFPQNKNANAIYSADTIQQKALEFLKGAHTKPFFLYLTYTLPHGDVIAPRDSLYHFYVKKFGDPALIESRKKTDGEEHRFEPYPHAAFAAMVGRLDRYVGEVIMALQKMGMQNNTLIIFTSDNGPHRENGGDPEFFNSSGGLRGIKRDMYEGGIRVPFIASWKNTIRPGTTSSGNFGFWDMYPTLLQVAGLAPAKNLDGISIFPLLTGRQQKAHDFLYWEFQEGGGKQAVRCGKWKAVKLQVNTLKDAPVELYDLATDPLEKTNVAAKFPDISKRLNHIILQSHQPDANWPLLVDEFDKNK